MRLRRCALGAVILFSVATLAAAQGFEGIFEDDSADDAAEQASPVSISGEVGIDFRYFMDNEWESEMEAYPAADLRFPAAAANAEAVFAMRARTSEAARGGLTGSLIDEAYVTSYFDAGHLTAGLLKVEWGTGDGVHAIDPLNPTDQSSGPSTDYLDSRDAEAMILLDLYLGSSANIEMVYKPFFHPTQAAVTGRWAVIDVATIPGYDTITPVNVRTLEYSQGAVRLSGSLGPADLGALYYVGFMPEPGYRFTSTFTGTDPLDPSDYTVTAELVYTRGQLVGTDAAVALGPFTLRGEAGYWFREDADGTAVELHNSRLVYLGGVDTTIPGTTLFVSAQVLGSLIMQATDLAVGDVDTLLMYGDVATSTSIIGAVEMPFARDTMKVRIGGIYNVEAEGYIVTPTYSWTIADGIELETSAQIIGGEAPTSGNSAFFAWKDNDNVSLSLRYRF